jgi:hypothetical protein
MSNNLDETLYNLVLTSLKYFAIDSKPITVPQYIAGMYQAVMNMTNNEEMACTQVAKIPSAMLRAMDEDNEVNTYLESHRNEIMKVKNELNTADEVKLFLSSVPMESLNVETARNKARAFIQKFDEAEVIDKLTVVIQFIEENKSFVEDCLNKLGPNNQEFKDVSDNIFMMPVSKINEFMDELKSDAAKRAKIFEQKEDIGYGKSMWDEYSYLLINNSRWPLTMDAKGLWAMCVLEFGQLKFAVDKDKSGGCFIATACYGSYDDSNVLILRNYRDNYLAKNYFGELFIRFYYFISPPIARIISKSEKLKSITRLIIVEPIVNLVKRK